MSWLGRWRCRLVGHPDNEQRTMWVPAIANDDGSSGVRPMFSWCHRCGARWEAVVLPSTQGGAAAVTDDSAPDCGCGHPKAEHLHRMDDCQVEGCPCPLYFMHREGLL